MLVAFVPGTNAVVSTSWVMIGLFDSDTFLWNTYQHQILHEYLHVKFEIYKNQMDEMLCNGCKNKWYVSTCNGGMVAVTETVKSKSLGICDSGKWAYRHVHNYVVVRENIDKKPLRNKP